MISNEGSIQVLAVGNTVEDHLRGRSPRRQTSSSVILPLEGRGEGEIMSRAKEKIKGRDRKNMRKKREKQKEYDKEKNETQKKKCGK